MQLFLFEKSELSLRILAWRADNARTKTLRDWIESAAVPAMDFLIARRP
jgi:hypothetical protein